MCWQQSLQYVRLLLWTEGNTTRWMRESRYSIWAVSKQNDATNQSPINISYPWKTPLPAIRVTANNKWRQGGSFRRWPLRSLGLRHWAPLPRQVLATADSILKHKPVRDSCTSWQSYVDFILKAHLIRIVLGHRYPITLEWTGIVLPLNRHWWNWKAGFRFFCCRYSDVS